MSRVFVYWDNSNIFIGARDVAEEREGRSVRHRVRIDFKAMMRLAHADRPVEKAIAAGSVPSELRALWNRLEAAGVQVETRSGRHSSTNTLTGQGQGGRLVPDAPERTPARVP